MDLHTVMREENFENGVISGMGINVHDEERRAGPGNVSKIGRKLQSGRQLTI